MSHGDMTKQDFENFSHMLPTCRLRTEEEEVSGQDAKGTSQTVTRNPARNGQQGVDLSLLLLLPL